MMTLGPATMFRGKMLPDFLRDYAELYAALKEWHGLEQVKRVYDFFYSFVNRMDYGQWMVLHNVCPQTDDPELTRRKRLLFYWVMEVLYQGDMFLRLRWEFVPLPDHPDRQECRIVRDAPGEEVTQRFGKPSVTDWYNRLLRNPEIHPDIDPAWLGLGRVASQWGGGEEASQTSDAAEYDGGETMTD